MPLSTFKVSTIDSPGTAQVFGTADFNKIARFLNGESDVVQAEIDSDIAILQNRLKLRDATNTNEVILNTDLAQSATVVARFPAMTTDDVILMAGSAQPITGKTIDIAGNSITDSSGAQTGDIWYYDSIAAKAIRLTRGSANQTLQMNGTGDGLVWGPGGVGSWNAATSESISNKTIPSNLNTINDSATNAVGDMLVNNGTKYVRRARGTVNQVLQATSADVTWGLISDVNVSAHTTTKISTTSKSLLNSNIVYKDQNNDFGAFYQDIAQISAPTSPASGRRRLFSNLGNGGQLSVVRPDGTTISLEASAWDPNLAETMTNKTIDAAFNSLNNVQLMPSVRKVGWWNGMAATAGTALLSSFLNSDSGTGSITFNKDSTNGSYCTFATGTNSSNNVAVFTKDTFTARALNATFKCKFRLQSVSSQRLDVGFTTDLSAPPGNSDYLASQSGACLSFGPGRGNGTSFYLSTNNGGSSSTFTGPIATAVANTIYTIEIKLDNTNNRVSYSFNGGTFNNITTSIPAASTLLGIIWGNQTNTGSSKSADFFWAETTTDK